MRRAVLIYNPKSGRGHHADLLPALLAALRQGGIAATPHPTAAPGHASGLAREAAGRAELALAFGGDGTVREVACGLLGTGRTLGILPGGTTNVLARALGLPLDPLVAAAEAGRLPVRTLDVGLAGEQPFLMMVSAGIDARILARIDAGWKRRFGQAAIAAQAVRDWWEYDYPELELRCGDRSLAGSFVAVANIPLYAGRFVLAPEARPDDGRLDGVVLHPLGRRANLGFALDLFLARHQERGHVAFLPLREGVLSGPPGAAYQIDGDVGAGCLPVAIGLSPHRLPVLAPAPSPGTPGPRPGPQP